MKTTKRILALMLSVLVLVSGCAIAAQAAEAKEIKIMSYNVAGQAMTSSLFRRISLITI